MIFKRKSRVMSVLLTLGLLLMLWPGTARAAAPEI
jgi:hypothetical protein